MTSTQDLGDLMAARRADLEGNARSPGEVEVIPPADPATGEILPAGAIPPAQAGPVAIETRYPEIPPKVVGGLPYVRDYVKLSRTISQTEMVPAAFRGRFDAITAAFMRGYEMGLGPMQALDSFNVIQGKVGLTAEAMRALILNAGHDIILSEVYENEVTLVGVKAECHRKQWPEDRWATYVYGLADARQAGLLNKTSWKENTRAMLDARATSGAGRRYFADVLAGMSYTPEEIRDFSGSEQEVPPSRTPVNQDASGQSAPMTPESAGNGSQTEMGSAPSETGTSDSKASQPSTATSAKKARGSTKKAAAKVGARDQIEEQIGGTSTDPSASTQTAPATAPQSATTPSLLSPSDSASTTPSTQDQTPTATFQTAAPPCTEDSESAETDAAGQSVIQPTEASTPSDQTGSPATSEPIDVTRQMARSLGTLLDARPKAEQALIRTFLGRHFPGRKAVDLSDEELTLAINIVAGWPESANTYPAPDEPPEG